MRTFKAFDGEIDPKTGKLIFTTIGIEVSEIADMKPYLFHARHRTETKKILVTRVTLKGNGGFYDLVNSPFEVWEKIHKPGEDENPYRRYEPIFRRQQVEGDILGG